MCTWNTFNVSRVHSDKLWNGGFRCAFRKCPVTCKTSAISIDDKWVEILVNLNKTPNHKHQVKLERELNKRKIDGINF